MLKLMSVFILWSYRAQFARVQFTNVNNKNAHVEMQQNILRMFYIKCLDPGVIQSFMLL